MNAITYFQQDTCRISSCIFIAKNGKVSCCYLTNCKIIIITEQISDLVCCLSTLCNFMCFFPCLPLKIKQSMDQLDFWVVFKFFIFGSEQALDLDKLQKINNIKRYFYFTKRYGCGNSQENKNKAVLTKKNRTNDREGTFR